MYQCSNVYLFIIFFKEESKVNIFPHAPLCTTPDAVELFCNISSKANVHCNVNWEHYFNGVHIRTLQGITNQQSSSLDINFCDFQDEGQYICECNINNRRLLGSAKLVVNGNCVFHMYIHKLKTGFETIAT